MFSRPGELGWGPEALEAGPLPTCQGPQKSSLELARICCFGAVVLFLVTLQNYWKNFLKIPPLGTHPGQSALTDRGQGPDSCFIPSSRCSPVQRGQERASESPGSLLRHSWLDTTRVPDSVGLQWGPGIYISNKTPGDTDAVDPGN